MTFDRAVYFCRWTSNIIYFVRCTLYKILYATTLCLEIVFAFKILIHFSCESHKRYLENSTVGKFQSHNALLISYHIPGFGGFSVAKFRHAWSFRWHARRSEPQWLCGRRGWRQEVPRHSRRLQKEDPQSTRRKCGQSGAKAIAKVVSWGLFGCSPSRSVDDWNLDKRRTLFISNCPLQW